MGSPVGASTPQMPPPWPAAVNAVNYRFRFAKFCIDTSDNTIQAELDTPFRAYDVGEICMELTARTVDICDKAYPDLMKAIWA